MTIYFNWLSAGWVVLAVVGFATNFYLLRLARRGEQRAPLDLHSFASLRRWRAMLRQSVHLVNFSIGWLGLLAPPAPAAGKTLTVVLFGAAVVLGLYLVHFLVVVDGFLEVYTNRHI